MTETLADVIAREIGPCNDNVNHDGRQWQWAADAVIAAVNDGRIAPIVPDGNVVIHPADNLAEQHELADLRTLAAELLAAWDAEDDQELNDLDDRLWNAVNDLRRVHNP